jgi:ATP-dependent DNA helicase RecG
MPPGRGKITTRFFKAEQAADVYKIIRDKVAAGQQAYIVYPLVEESEKLDLKAARAMYQSFVKNEFKDLKVGLVHGQMKSGEAEKVMDDFKKKKIHILVATTILEVGVDVPNANVMVIEHAERFGLSQLHQLRGRIGRGKENGLCLLIGDPLTEDAVARIKAIVGSIDGFKIAQEDLLIRGPGHYFGRHQHGLNELRFANPLTQVDILELARKEAQELIHLDPDLRQDENRVLMKEIQRRYPTYLAMVEAG